ncbi:MAG: hypothetical protein HYY01_02575 [Chloroflexi bacterium]|nr:hypothetical protein [Chloroflexota bacterium]
MPQQPELTPRLRQRLKDTHGYTDEQLDLYLANNPRALRVIHNFAGKFREYKMVAEVVQSRGCALHLKAGDKLVLTSDGLLLADESTAALCLWALAPLVPWNYMVYDRLIEGQDPTEFGLDRVRCLDVGLECGGWGEVLMKVYCIREPWSPSAVTNRRYVAQRKD